MNEIFHRLQHNIFFKNKQWIRLDTAQKMIYIIRKEKTNINRINGTNELMKEIAKHPNMPVCVGMSGDELGRHDQFILNVEVRDGVLLLNVANYKENGLLKFYR